MPYVPRMKYVILKYSAPTNAYLQISNIAADETLEAITLPTLVGDIIGINVNYQVGHLLNLDGGNENYTAGAQNIQMDVDAGGYDTVLVIPDASFDCAAGVGRSGAKLCGDFILQGSLTKRIVWGSVLTFKWTNSEMNTNGIDVVDSQITLELLVRL